MFALFFIFINNMEHNHIFATVFFLVSFIAHSLNRVCTQHTEWGTNKMKKKFLTMKDNLEVKCLQQQQ